MGRGVIGNTSDSDSEESRFEPLQPNHFYECSLIFWVTTTTTNVGDFMNGGDIIGAVLAAQGVKHVFTLCGGHISPILVGAKQRGIRIIDVRSEANAVFAADGEAPNVGTTE